MARFPVEATAATQNGGTVRVLPFATVTVKTPSEDLATLYAAATGSETVDNPLITDGAGNYSFWLDLGTTYLVTFVKGAAGGSYYANSDYQDGPIIKALYEAEANAFTDAQFTKLAGIETAATADQTGAEIKSLYEAEADTNAYTDAEKAKIAAFEVPFATRAAMLAATIPAAVVILRCLHDGRVTSFVRDAAGTAATTADGAKWSPADDATPGHWGAVADGTTDNSSEFSAMFAWCLATSAGETRRVRLDQSFYSLASEVVATWNSVGTTLIIEGSGSHQTVIYVRNVTGGFDFDMSDLGIHKLTIKGISFVAKGPADASVARCIRMTGSGASSAKYSMQVMDDVTFEVDRDNLLGSAFVNAVDLQSCIRPHITNTYGWGRYGPGAVEADWMIMDTFMNFYDCFGPLLEHVRAWSCRVGFQMETVTLEGGQFFKVGTGGDNAFGLVVIGNDRTMPNVYDCYFDSVEGGITLTNVNDPQIENTTFWCSNKYTPGSGERYDIKLINVQRGILKNNMHRFSFAALTNQGAILDVNSSNNTIDSPSLMDRDYGVRDYGTNNRIYDAYGFDGGQVIRLESTSSGCRIRTPAADSSTVLFGAHASAANYVVDHAERWRVKVALTAAQSIATATDTTITWTIESVEVGGAWVTVPSQTITVPANLGIRRVRVSVQSRWGNNSTGQRRVWVTKNTVRGGGLPGDTRTANSLSYSAIVGDIDVVGGDVFRVLVQQTSGVAQNYGPTDTFFTVEAIG